MSLTLESRAFQQDGAIPTKFTCDGRDLSPALEWRNPPAGTLSFTLIVDDPDAPNGTWVHWLLYDLPPTASHLDEGMSPLRELPSGARQGMNDFRRIGYGGPCPPRGSEHRYYFRLFALDAMLGLRPGAKRPEIEAAMAGHVLARAELMGHYGR